MLLLTDVKDNNNTFLKKFALFDFFHFQDLEKPEKYQLISFLGAIQKVRHSGRMGGELTRKVTKSDEKG